MRLSGFASGGVKPDKIEEGLPTHEAARCSGKTAQVHRIDGAFSGRIKDKPKKGWPLSPARLAR